MDAGRWRLGGSPPPAWTVHGVGTHTHIRPAICPTARTSWAVIASQRPLCRRGSSARRQTSHSKPRRGEIPKHSARGPLYETLSVQCALDNSRKSIPSRDAATSSEGPFWKPDPSSRSGPCMCRGGGLVPPWSWVDAPPRWQATPDSHPHQPLPVGGVAALCLWLEHPSSSRLRH